jgi:hypothetical protein
MDNIQVNYGMQNVKVQKTKQAGKMEMLLWEDKRSIRCEGRKSDWLARVVFK